jgi:hypothetical protein
MVVTKETYTAPANWTTAEAADVLKDAFIDAGYMADWHDSFTISGSRIARVLRIQYDSTKTYGTSFYIFYFDGGFVRHCLASGWDTATKVPTGTQFLDYFVLPTNYSTSDNSPSTSTSGIFSGSQTSDLFLDRYTSGDDTKQTWLVFRQGTNTSFPFSILHEDTVLQPWLDLDKGMISGHSKIATAAANRAGVVNFRMDALLLRVLLTGSILRGISAANSLVNNRAFNTLNHNIYSYFGCGSVSSNPSSNISGSFFRIANTDGNSYLSSAFPLPVGKNSANPAFLTDYIPICTDLPWSPWTPTRLADDFAVYMHYASNTIAYGNKFIVQAGINEWETLSFANNAVINDGASATFLARVV